MINNKFLKRFMAIFLTFITVLSFSSEVFAISVTPEKMKEIRDKLEMAGPLEMALTEQALPVGDFIMEYITFLIKEEITVKKIIFNEVDALNANFFKDETGETVSKSPVSGIIVETVNTWYNFLGKLVIIIYMIALVVVGIRTMLGGVGAKAQAQELFMKWTMGLVIFYFFPYVMKYSFELNDVLLGALSGEDTSVGTYVGEVSDLRTEDYEFRSPKYVKRGSYILTLGSEEATRAYIENVNKYSERGDMMRIIRALAGITGRIIYVIIWFIMLWQLLVFIFVYYKRFLIIAFLIAIFPITLIEYIIGTVSTGKQSALSSWSKEFFINVFLQSIHAVVYTIIAEVVMTQITTALSAAGGITSINWILMIIAVNFVFTGEKMLRDIISAAATTIQNPEDVSNKTFDSAKKIGNKTKKTFSKMTGG